MLQSSTEPTFFTSTLVSNLNIAETSSQPPDINLSSKDLEGIEEVEYIKPAKIHLQPLHYDDELYESKKYNSSGLATGNFYFFCYMKYFSHLKKR